MAIVLDGTNGITTNSGTVISASTIGVGGATPSTSGAGITFPATQSASSDANTLDDYEEGTWTPSGWNGGGTGLSYVGSYNKIGRQVTVYFRIAGTGITSTAASSILSGLPFVPSSTPSPDYFMGVCMNGQTTNGGVIQAYSDSKIYWAVSIASTTTLSGSVTYFV